MQEKKKKMFIQKAVDLVMFRSRNFGIWKIIVFVREMVSEIRQKKSDIYPPDHCQMSIRS